MSLTVDLGDSSEPSCLFGVTLEQDKGQASRPLGKCQAHFCSIFLGRGGEQGHDLALAAPGSAPLLRLQQPLKGKPQRTANRNRAGEPPWQQQEGCHPYLCSTIHKVQLEHRREASQPHQSALASLPRWKAVPLPEKATAPGPAGVRRGQAAGRPAGPRSLGSGLCCLFLALGATRSPLEALAPSEDGSTCLGAVA